jgi:hypothetical protein
MVRTWTMDLEQAGHRGFIALQEPQTTGDDSAETLSVELSARRRNTALNEAGTFQ